MSTNEATVRATYFNTSFRFGIGGLKSETERRGEIFQVAAPMPSGVSDTTTIHTEEMRETHPFAAMFGALADHPLRDEFLEILGMGQEQV